MKINFRTPSIHFIISQMKNGKIEIEINFCSLLPVRRKLLYFPSE